jgi:hypothetical protein
MTTVYDEKAVSDISLTGFKAAPRAGAAVERRPQDPAAFLNATEQMAREYAVGVETVKILRKDVILCYRREGVNHYNNCRKEVDAYVNCISDPLLFDVKRGAGGGPGPA